HRRQPAHGVAGDPVCAMGRASHATVNIASPDHQRDLYAEGVHVLDLLGEEADDLELEAERLRSHEGFAGELEEDSAELGLSGHVGSLREIPLARRVTRTLLLAVLAEDETREPSDPDV